MNIYQQQILDHYHNPRNFGQPEQYDYTAEVENLSCGDAVQMFIKTLKPDINKESSSQTAEEIVNSVAFTGEGCAISLAAASLLTEFLPGKTIGELKALTMEDMMELLGIELTTSRRRCAEISLEAIKSAIGEQ